MSIAHKPSALKLLSEAEVVVGGGESAGEERAARERRRPRCLEGRLARPNG